MKEKNKTEKEIGIRRILSAVVILGLIGMVTAMPVAATASMDEKLKDLIDTVAPEYYNSNWEGSISVSQFKAWIAIISLTEGPTNQFGYAVQSTGRLGHDVFNHKDLGRNFMFSTGIGPFQLDNGGSEGGESWTTMTTLDKTDPEKSLRSILSWHNVRFGTKWEGALPPTLSDFYTKTKNRWFGPGDSMARKEFKPLWNSITDSNWDEVKSKSVDVAFHPPTINAPYENYVRKLSNYHWNILDGNYGTWLIKGKGPSYSGEFYYTHNDKLEIWVYNDATKNHGFVRKYTETQLPEDSSGNTVIISDATKSAGFTYAKEIIDLTPTLIITSPKGGEEFETGSELNVQWMYIKDPGDHVDVELLKDGVAVEGIGVRVLTDTKSAVLCIPKIIVLGGGYQIKITGVKDGVRTEYIDISDEFTIYGQQIIVDSPNGGENWPKPSFQTIKWKYNGNPGNFVNIELLKGTDVIPLTPIMVPIGINGEGSYTISVTQPDGADYKIRISTDKSYTESNQWLSDTSDGYFSIGTNICSASTMTTAGIKISSVSTDPCTPPPPPPSKKLELIFAVDTTGSMWDDIAAVKAAINEIIAALDKEGFDYRIAVINYKDKPIWPFGDPTDYVYKLNLPFTGKDNKPAIISAINSLGASGGADAPEAVYSALVLAMEDPNKNLANSTNHGWTEGATKAIIIMGDAPPHIPEPWAGGHTLADVISTSESIDPVIVYSIVIGSSGSAYDAFSAISSGTNGKVYTSPHAADVVAAIIEAIGDIGETPVSRGVFVSITPSLSETTPGNSAGYTVNVTNIGSLNDTYDISLELNNFIGFQRGYPVAIQPSWVNFNSAQIMLDSGTSEIRPLTVTVPQNWAGMEDIIYSVNITATSTTNASVVNTSSAGLKVKADKRSMAEYSKLEIQWLREMVNGANITNEGVKNALTVKLDNAESKVDSAIANIGNEIANENLNTAQNALNAFTELVKAQYDKKIMQPDAAQLEEKASQIIADLEKAKNS